MTAFRVAGKSAGGLLIAVAVVVGFLAQEPAGEHARVEATDT